MDERSHRSFHSVRSQRSQKSKKSNFESQADEEEEEEDESEEEGPTGKKYNFSGWLKWTKAEAMVNSNNEDAEFKKRALYRLGMFAQTEGSLDESLDLFERVKGFDKNFCRE